MLQELKKRVLEEYGIQFQDEKYLIEAMTHSSYSNEHKEMNGVYNERIEFLGDAVLELFVSRWLFLHFPKMKEGELSRLRAQIVCEKSFALLAKECRLDQFVLLGKGEEAMGGRQRPALLCDLFEAFVGAIYLDKGFDEVSQFLEKVVASKIQDGKFLLNQDYKTDLQEELQKQGSVKIEYIVNKEIGPSHDKEFYVSVLLEGQVLANGVGRSKKAAEQEAAKIALEQLAKK
ncbi:RNAse III [Granulicatella balaenopterae]|uniref:Ribonuclease 3 n=1 Tax=Granulicatella balaenopterae TaxID=137733 RepID=A0A1H9PBS9_9LACT|nr:ribonuclease III [Granulicatella balaenopterae]SER45704.1 RNAse III [Granulicatella balaenopterae]